MANAGPSKFYVFAVVVVRICLLDALMTLHSLWRKIPTVRNFSFALLKPAGLMASMSSLDRWLKVWMWFERLRVSDLEVGLPGLV
jgi:hypothetical protein